MMVDGLPIGSPKQRVLLALLVINANQVLSADRIVDELLGDEAPESGAKTVAWHVSKLRDMLEPGRRAGDHGGILLTERGGYVLRTELDHIDTVRCERVATEARGLMHDDPHAAEVKLREALLLCRCPPLADLAYEPFAQLEIRRLDELRLRILEDRLEVDLMLGRHDLVIGELEGLSAEHPLRERFRGQLMLALYRSDRQAEALRTYQEGRRILAEELGIDPSPVLQQLEQQILQQDPNIQYVRLRPADTTVRNPYKGLRHFGECEAADFFGRESLTTRLVQRMTRATDAERLFFVVGPSGSGKSSVVRAGAVPGSERWHVSVMLPGSRPLEQLAAGLLRVASDPPPSLLDQLEQNAHGLDHAVMRILPDDDSTLVLVIDQFEELISLVTDDAVRNHFLDSLLTAVSGEHSSLLVVCTLRADFLRPQLSYPDFGELVRAGLEEVTPLTRNELETAIRRPAEEAGVQLERGLATEIASDVMNQPGALPLLQYTLTELFDGSDGRVLTHSTYSSIGGVLGALGRRSDDVYEGLDAKSRVAARRMFLRLVTLGEGTVDARHRVPHAELESVVGDRDLLDTVVEAFGRSRLLTFDRDQTTGEPTVELAHEALLSKWHRLARWVDEGREDIRKRRHFSEVAEDWARAGHTVEGLLSGSRLEQFESWAFATDLWLSDAERAFLNASLAERHRNEQEAIERAEHEQHLGRRAKTRLRILAGVLAVATGFAVALALAAFAQ